ncbi:hypothetical protein D777_01351 [Marinobacter nitratireducens]|uniref:Uncharacterized protein n=1 Tax=Marinobacter nitratireducens TaxID=1137280 RepID=A0A072N641_9GAMM|nr:hypothetical protein D777_01351 [Marinobacter nitratireducens]
MFLAYNFGAGTDVAGLFRNRYEHIHVRLFTAILGLQHS